MSDVLKFEGLDEYKVQLQTLQKHFPDEAEKELRKLGNILKKKAIEKTPDGEEIKLSTNGKELSEEGKKRREKLKLKNAYHLSTTKQAGSTIFLEFNSSSPHFHLVERGHKIVDKKGNEHGFAPGKHMVEQSMGEMESETPEELVTWMDKMISRYDL